MSDEHFQKSNNRGATLTLDTEALKSILPDSAIMMIRDIATEKLPRN